MQGEKGHRERMRGVGEKVEGVEVRVKKKEVRGCDGKRERRRWGMREAYCILSAPPLNSLPRPHPLKLSLPLEGL